MGNLGLYICSFHVMSNLSNKSNRYIIDLNMPIRYKDNEYAHMKDFLLDFLKNHENPVNVDSEQRVFYIETNPKWEGSTENYEYVMFRVHSGIYGMEADIYDKNKKEVVGKKEKNQADVMPFVIVAIFPKSICTEDGKPINKGILFFQSNGVYGVKGITMSLLENYAKEKIDSTIPTYNVAPGVYLDKLFEISKLKRIRMIKNQRSYDKSDLLGGISYGKEERIVSGFLFDKIGTVLEGLKKFGLDKKAIYQWSDNTQYDNVKIDVEIGKGNIRTIDLHNFDNRSILEYIPDEYQNENGHADVDRVLGYILSRADSYLKEMSCTVDITIK